MKKTREPYLFSNGMPIPFTPQYFEELEAGNTADVRGMARHFLNVTLADGKVRRYSSRDSYSTI